MTTADMTREASAVVLGAVLGVLTAWAFAGLAGATPLSFFVLVVVPVSVCALLLRRTSRGIVPAVSVTLVVEIVIVAVVLDLGPPLSR